MLDELHITPSVVVDVARGAATEHGRRRPRLVRAAALLAISIACEVATVATGVADNILWAPLTPTRAMALAATVAPVLALATLEFRDRTTTRSTNS